jgi:hypothetical protein
VAAVEMTAFLTGSLAAVEMTLFQQVQQVRVASVGMTAS